VGGRPDQEPGLGPGAVFLGSIGGKALNKPLVGIAVDAQRGYYEVASDGGIFA
jgi:hypothetical protein